MKPIRIIMQAFGPYKNREEVDFEKLSKNQVFLIKGPTGSGKTTIFDAMMFALYGGSSGDHSSSKTGRNEMSQWRCNQADPDTDTVVSFEFFSQGTIYRFTRKLVRKRKNYSKVYEAGFIDKEGNYCPFFENPKESELNKKAEELIGLNKEQFRQVVLLPQGQFERFLTATSAEKEEILTRIFDAGQWEGYANCFFDAASEKLASLQEIKNRMMLSLEEEGVEKIEDLEQLLLTINQNIRATEEAHVSFDGAKEQQALNADIALSVQFDTLHSLEKKRQSLELQKTEMVDKKKRQTDAENAEAVREFLKEFDDANAQVLRRDRVLASMKEKVAPAKQNLENTKIVLKKHTDASPIEKYQKNIAVLDSKRTVYESFDTLKKVAVEAQSNWKSANQKMDQCNRRYEKCQNTSKNLYMAYEEAEKTVGECRRKYYAEIYGIAAEKLEEGKKCPVCGSTSHPEPARKSPDSVSKEQLDQYEEDSKQAKASWETSRLAEADALTAKNTAIQKESECRTIYETAVNRYRESLKNLVEGIQDLAALDAAIENLKNCIEQYNKKTTELQNAMTTAERLLSTANANVSSAQNELQSAQVAASEAQKNLNEALTDHGYTNQQQARENLMLPSELKALREEIAQYLADVKNNARQLEEKQQALQGVTEPDFARFDERQQEINRENHEYTAAITKLNSDRNRIQTKVTNLKETSGKYESQIQQAECDMAFARKLRGDTGIGLQRYVLGIMFGQVISEANRMLDKVHNGRYHLFRTDNKGVGNKRGLELMVYDQRGGDAEGRSVAMLSGGEKFLVSLSLSIGMSAVAQKSGVQIEALFIDEGFGTLDEDSIGDAMDVLKSVQENNSLIGIISHVKILEANIPTHLEVLKSDAGSSLRMN